MNKGGLEASREVTEVGVKESTRGSGHYKIQFLMAICLFYQTLISWQYEQHYTHSQTRISVKIEEKNVVFALNFLEL